MRLRNAVDPGINYSMSFAEWEACAAAGLDLWRWEMGLYPLAFKERVIAWHGLHNLVNLFGQEAADEAGKKKSK